MIETFQWEIPNSGRNLLFLLACLQGAVLSAADDRLSQVEKTMDRWVELEQRVAVEENAWGSERELLVNTAAALTKEQASLSRNLASFELASRLYENNLKGVTAEIDRIKVANDKFSVDLGLLEKQVRDLGPSLPEPLMKHVNPLLANTGKGEGDEERSMAERSQNLMAILSAISQFANSLTLTHSLRTSDSDGSRFDVEVLYWGLAIGFATDAAGSRGWILRPGESGWTWEEFPDGGPDIKTLIGVYKKQREPVLVTLPASIRGFED